MAGIIGQPGRTIQKDKEKVTQNNVVKSSMVLLKPYNDTFTEDLFFKEILIYLESLNLTVKNAETFL